MSVSERIEKIRKLADHGKYDEALELANGIDNGKVKSLTDLAALADVYDATGNYDDAYTLLLRIYDKTKTRKILYQLSCIAVKQKNTVAAERYYREFLEIAPTDPDQYVIRFLLDRLEKKDLSEQIESLERLKEEEYVEEWAFELARLYHKNGNPEKCVRECKDIILWFGDGPIVDRARGLLEIYEGKQEVSHRPAKTAEEPEPEEEEDEDAEQLELDLVTEDEEEDLGEQLELELVTEEPAETEEADVPSDAEEPLEAENSGLTEIKAEEAEEIKGADAGSDSFDEYNEEPEYEDEILSESRTAELPVIAEASEIPDDPLTVLAVDLLREEDYIVSDENVKDIQFMALEIKEEYGEDDRALQMTRRVREVIDKAEKRSMSKLLEVVNNGSYGTSEFLILKKEDFSN